MTNAPFGCYHIRDFSAAPYPSHSSASPKIMLKVLKWLGIGVAGLLGVVIILVGALFLVGRSKANKAPDVATRPVIIQQGDAGSLARGRHIAEAITGCEGCHGPGLGGKPFLMPALLTTMAAPNLTRGQGGVGASYTPEDWERAIRHGVGKDGRRLLIMPAEAYNYLNDSDLAALIAYLQSIPAIDQTFPPRKIGIAGGAMLGAGMMPVPVDLIAHDSVGARPVVQAAANAAYGEYLVNSAGCKVCHGSNLNGERQGAGGPPLGPSLVAFVANNSADAFRATLRTGRTPSGRALDPEQMPWPTYRNLTDDEIEAIRLYVQSTFPGGSGSL
jgi:mono/diheme cytochrome c family protein